MGTAENTKRTDKTAEKNGVLQFHVDSDSSHGDTTTAKGNG